MGTLDGRVAIVTGGGRGLGREHALLFAAEGASVVVNDLGDAGEQVADEITKMGGNVIANDDSVDDWEGGQRLVQSAIDAFGQLDVLVNNAGILRDRALVNMSPEEWDSVVSVHMRGHFVPTRWAAAHWRERAKAGEDDVRASVIHTSSTSGLLGNPGQSNYGAAKAGIAAFSVICSRELGRYGVRSNCIAPAARTRLTESAPGLGDIVQPPSDVSKFDVWDPANVSPLVALLAAADCPYTGQTFFVQGGVVRIMEPWRMAEGVERDDRWTIGELRSELDRIVHAPE